MTTDLVLDVDFDYCVQPTHDRGDARRQADAFIWLRAAELVEWLDSRGLLRRESFAGAVESHEQVLSIWIRLVENRTLRLPFALLHVDAHPDLMDLEPALAAALESASSLDDDSIRQARPGDFLQFAVRLGWVDRIWMLFPDHERDCIAALETMSLDEVSAILRKPVESLSRSASGGVDLCVRLGRRVLPVALHTRATLPALPPPTITVLAHSPEFTPPGSDDEFHVLARSLGAAS